MKLASLHPLFTQVGKVGEIFVGQIEQTSFKRVLVMLALIIAFAGNAHALLVTWDPGNTNNGALIDPADGLWDNNDPNAAVWNVGDGSPNVALLWTNTVPTNSVILGGTNGTYAITPTNGNILNGIVVSNISFQASGYTLSAPAATNRQTIRPAGTGNAGAPQFIFAPNTTNTVGTNVSLAGDGPNLNSGGAGNTPAGTLIVENGAEFGSLNSGRALGINGNGTVITVKKGGFVGNTSGGSGTAGVAVCGVVGGNVTINVDGGTFGVRGANMNLGLAVAGTGVLNLNSGTVSFPANSATPIGFTVANGNNASGTINLNGGTLTAPKLVHNPIALNATAIVNFNGGILKAVRTNDGDYFEGMTRANVRDGGAIIDSTNVTITVNQTLDHSDQGGDNAIDGGLAKIGSGTLTLTAFHTYTGPTVVSNGTLRINGSIVTNATVKAGGTIGGTGTIGGSVDVNAGGALAPGAGIGTLTLSSDLILSGNVVAEVDKAASPSNDLCVVSGLLTNAGTGTVTLTNLNGGAPLAAGDAFTLFSQPVLNGGALNIQPPVPGVGLAWTNKLAIDGSIGVVAAPATATYPTNITATINGSTLSLGWPLTHLSWIVQSNSVSLIDTNFWFDIAGSDAGTNFNLTINPAQTNVFFRLRHP